MKRIILDMDGSMFDLYGVEDWLEKLQRRDHLVYRQARPMFDSVLAQNQMQSLKQKGYTFIICSWLSKTGTKDFDFKIRMVKREALMRTTGIKYYSEIHLVKYGTSKNRYMKEKGAILFDDNKEIRERWEKEGGISIDASKVNLNEFLASLLRE